MRYAVFSDLHDSFRGLDSVLDHAARRQADSLIYLGDVGHNPDLFRVLRSHAIPCVFGNWEVSGYHRLPPPLTTEVAEWSAVHYAEAACFCHATPAMPARASTTQAAAGYMKMGQSWHSLFPRLHLDEPARWDALAALDAAEIRVAFHGHTHIQMI